MKKEGAKKNYSGDGKSLYNAVITSNLRTSDFFAAMNISRGTLYNYYESPDLDFSIKEQAAKILKRSIKDIFDQTYVDNGSLISPTILSESETPGYTTGKKSKDKNNTGDDLLNIGLQPKQNVVPMINRLITLLERKEDNMQHLIANNEKFANGLLELIAQYGNKDNFSELKKQKAG